jgi:hypothetical protein
MLCRRPGALMHDPEEALMHDPEEALTPDL